MYLNDISYTIAKRPHEFIHLNINLVKSYLLFVVFNILVLGINDNMTEFHFEIPYRYLCEVLFYTFSVVLVKI